MRAEGAARFVAFLQAWLSRNHVVLAAVIAPGIYCVANLFSFQFMDERNWVIDGQLVPNGDHWPVAEQILSGQSVTLFRHPPGFPLYIASALTAAERLGGSYFGWRLMQDCVSTAITAALTMSLMLRLTDSIWCGWGAVCLLLYNLTYTAGTAADLGMASFLPWFLGSVFLLVKSFHARQLAKGCGLLAGALLAVSGFIRPDILLFLPFLGSIFWVFGCVVRTGDRANQSTLIRPLVFPFRLALLGFVLAVLPWTIYASSRSRSVVIYSTGFLPSHVHGMSQFAGNPVSEAFRAPVREFNSILEIGQLHLTLLKAYPADYARLWLQKLWQPWYASQTERWNLIIGLQSLLICPFVFTGVFLWLRTRGLDLGFVVAIAVVSYFWLITLSVLSINRYMPPAYPFLGMFVGLSVERLRNTRYLWILRKHR